ncbi:MAG: hypothetical protein E7241_03140 [Lachnospiraceae bacterium]|nr:hypothetical protein [Lachnospiraceae bacterium]
MSIIKGRFDGPKDVVAGVKDFKEKRGIKGIILVVVIMALILAGIFFFLNRGYSGYKVLDRYSSGANASVKFASYGTNILRYSNDGISSLNDKFESNWTQGYNMQKPLVDVCGEYVVCGDYHGEEIYIFNNKGLVTKISVTYMLEDLKVSAKGGVFAVLADKERKYMKYYDKNGDTIAEGLVQLKKTGYPLSFDISEDGRLLAMSYLYISSGILKSSIVFYNFDKAGESEIDRIVASYEYSDAVIPQVSFYGNDMAVAVGDSAAYFFEGSEKPTLKKTMDFDHEAESVFVDGDKLGVVWANPGSDKPYHAEIYKSNGTRIGNFDLDTVYDSYAFSGENILAYNDNDCKLYSMSGAVKFNYTFENRIFGMTPVNGKERFVLVTSDEAQVIALK